MPNPTDTARALVEAYEAKVVQLTKAQKFPRSGYLYNAEFQHQNARAALLAYVDTLRIERDGFKELYEEWLTWAKGAVEKCKPEIPPSDSPQAQGIIDERLAHVAGVDTSEQRCKTCRFAVTDRDGEMECERMSRVQHVGSLSNGTACATPCGGCSAVLDVTPDFGCVRWEARKDGV